MPGLTVYHCRVIVDYVQISGTGQGRTGQDWMPNRMTLPHQQATKLGQSVPVTKGTPSPLVREWQSEAAPLREPRCMPTGSLVLEPPANLPLYLCMYRY